MAMARGHDNDHTDGSLLILDAAFNQLQTSHVSLVALSILLSFSAVIQASPLEWSHAHTVRAVTTNNQNDSFQGPISGSSDVWATVIANVAPLMALVGEPNAQEFLRVASSHNQLLVIATAPIGILSIMVGAIRLSGSHFLRRLVGRESERWSKALLELTPMSVSPAYSVYTQRAVEIQSGELRDQVAFVCAHVKHAKNACEALTAFKRLLEARYGKSENDRDFEIVLGLKENTLDEEDTKMLVSSLINEELPIDKSLTNSIKSVSLSFRTTGISPTQTAGRTGSWERHNIRNVSIGIFSFALMSGVQIAGYFHGGLEYGAASSNSLIMGLCGYCGVATFTLALLILIQQEVSVEPQFLPHVFDDAVWTFSDSYHAEHRAFDAPLGRTLVQAAPADFGLEKKIQRQWITFCICAGLTCSYVVYYLGIRVAPWWVAFSSLATTWLAASFRAAVSKNHLMANDADLGEHWLGIFRKTLYESLLETVATIKRASDASSTPESDHEDEEKPYRAITEQASSVSISSKSDREFQEKADVAIIEQASNASITPRYGQERQSKQGGARTLVVVKPIRQSLYYWSGCEDVMKVSLEMVKHKCITHSLALHVDELAAPKQSAFKHIIRFNLMMYVPGLIWKARIPVDYMLTRGLDLSNLYRDILKLFHLCDDVEGDIIPHSLTDIDVIELSHILCGPITIPKEAELPVSPTLADFLCFLRSLEKRPGVKHYTLEQAMLLPTIQLTAMYEVHPETLHSPIESHQKTHTDKLSLSGAECLPNLERVFEDNGIWDHFMTRKDPEKKSKLKPRDETSGHYGGGMISENESMWLQKSASAKEINHASRVAS